MQVRISLNIAIVCVTILILSVIGAITWIAVVHDGSVAEMVIVALISVVSAFATGLSGVGQSVAHALGGGNGGNGNVTVQAPVPVSVQTPVQATAVPVGVTVEPQQ